VKWVALIYCLGFITVGLWCSRRLSIELSAPAGRAAFDRQTEVEKYSEVFGVSEAFARRWLVGLVLVFCATLWPVVLWFDGWTFWRPQR
jgi:hypothetical protein